MTESGRTTVFSGGTEGWARRFRRTREDHATEIAEDYVELIEQLTRELGEARATDLARHLGVSPTTVTRTLQRLQAEGLVVSPPYRSIFLTDVGRRLAEESRRRHEIVEGFLLALGVPPEDAAVDAEGIEHHISPSTLAAMKRFAKRAQGNRAGHRRAR